jgi:hypothetical protein
MEMMDNTATDKMASATACPRWSHTVSARLEFSFFMEVSAPEPALAEKRLHDELASKVETNWRIPHHDSET